MPKLVVNGAKLQCSEGLAPGSLTVLPTNLAETGALPVATVMDHLPMVNIAPFGMCKTQANPQVAAATAAASGALTPMPCTPLVTAPWSSGSSAVEVSAQKALTDDSSCTCLWTGRITITDPASDIDLA
ncbi:MAG: DUF4280 domain-containing protein [Byssovorax sp.]